ncbi:MAG: response regulator transcription factor [Anaerolineae bacterium]|nr:response regulator transcription factor [Anaerolineae bacterium]
MIRVLICDDQWIVCEGLEAILGVEPDIRVVGLAQDGVEALALIPQLEPDVVLMDLKMPVMNGVQATRKIKALYPKVKVLVLTTYGDEEWVFDAVRNGASGYLLKGTPRAQLVAAVKGTAAGESFVDPKVAGRLLDHIAMRGAPAADSTLVDSLTEREREVLAQLAQGKSNAEIAKELYLSPGTVRNYISAILTKLDVTDRTQAALLALRHGLV